MLRLPPAEIERRSFAAIAAELGPDAPAGETAPLVLRVIHATADLDFARVMAFSPGATAAGLASLRDGAMVVTDTTMALAGINKTALARRGGAGQCLVADPEVAREAAARGCTRSLVAAERAAARWPDAVYVVGNAPTALLRLCELIDAGVARPRLVVGVPVGFVNVVESKEALMRRSVPWIVSRGRKGGSPVAAAVVNALLYMLDSAEERP